MTGRDFSRQAPGRKRSPRPIRRRWLRPAAAFLFLAAGTALLASAGWDVLRRESAQRRDVAFVSRAAGDPSPEPSAIGWPEPPPAPLEPGEVIGVLRIPSSNVEASIREGVGDEVLDVAAGHLPGTALPGEPGNSALAAHRDGLFAGLREVETGDLIEVETTGGGRSTYRVTDLFVVDPTDVSVLDPTPEPTLTLITCYPFRWVGPAPQRFVVRAARVG